MKLVDPAPAKLKYSVPRLNGVNPVLKRGSSSLSVTLKVFLRVVVYEYSRVSPSSVYTETTVPGGTSGPSP